MILRIACYSCKRDSTKAKVDICSAFKRGLSKRRFRYTYGQMSEADILLYVIILIKQSSIDKSSHGIYS